MRIFPIYILYIILYIFHIVDVFFLIAEERRGRGTQWTPPRSNTLTTALTQVYMHVDSTFFYVGKKRNKFIFFILTFILIFQRSGTTGDITNMAKFRCFANMCNPFLSNIIYANPTALFPGLRVGVSNMKGYKKSNQEHNEI